MAQTTPVSHQDARRLEPARGDRDRFVALAFCWAEFLVELDDHETVSFAAGAAESLIGRGPSTLTGVNFEDLVLKEDRALARQLVAFARERGRIQGITLRLARPDGTPVRLLVAGYKLDELEGHFFFAFRRPPASQLGAAVREGPSGLFQADSFVKALSAAPDSGILEAGQRITFIGADGYDALRDAIDRNTENELQSRIGSLLRACSVGGDSAVYLAPGRFGLLHEPELDIGNLTDGVSDLVRAADPSGRGVSLRSATVEIDEDAYRNTDIAKGLVFTINRFRSVQGDAFNLEGLSNRLSALASEAAASVRDFKTMVAETRFAVAFQPIVEAATGAVHHYEALARFADEPNGQSPFQRIQFAEETGLIVDFDLAMVAKVVEWLDTTPRNSKTAVAVNISGHSVGTAAFSASLHRLLSEYPWTRGRLMFEITESARMDRLGAANAFIQSLRGAGYPVCLDDFGAGAANFQYLARLEVDTVKLDGLAVRNARKGPKGKAFLRALVGLCRELGVTTIAEMVEDESDIHFVRGCGVHFIQGHLVGMPAPDITDFARTIPKHLFAQPAAA